jgi:DNA-binding response OmpR family regulator
MPRDVLLAALDKAADPRLERAFRQAGYAVTAAAGSVDTATLAAGWNFDAVLVAADAVPPILALLPIVMPTGSRPLPVCCIVAADATAETALLEAGAALCLPPAAAADQVVERMRTLMRLATGQPRRPQLGDLDVDPAERRAYWRGTPLTLRPTEFELLLRLAHRAGEAVAATELTRRLWPDQDVALRRLTVHIHHLRAALAAITARPLLHSLPGGFYLLSAQPPAGGRRRRP